MFIWDFVAAKVLGQIVDWFYSQIVGFLGNFFSEMVFGSGKNSHYGPGKISQM